VIVTEKVARNPSSHTDSTVGSLASLESETETACWCVTYQISCTKNAFLSFRRSWLDSTTPRCRVDTFHLLTGQLDMPGHE
jgi:hypothetical protein